MWSTVTTKITRALSEIFALPDNGPQFVRKEFEDFLPLCGIEHS